MHNKHQVIEEPCVVKVTSTVLNERVGKQFPARLKPPEKLLLKGINPLIVKAKGHGKRQRCGTDRYGFPIRHAPAQKFFIGFQTGDLVKANVLTGKYAGTYMGRIAIRFKPSFKLTTGGNSFDVHPRYLRTIHKADGYEYTF